MKTNRFTMGLGNMQRFGYRLKLSLVAILAICFSLQLTLSTGASAVNAAQRTAQKKGVDKNASKKPQESTPSKLNAEKPSGEVKEEKPDPNEDVPLKKGEKLSITGKAVQGYEELEKIALEYRDLVKASAMTMAVSRNGKMYFNRGYGWREKDHAKPTQPDDVFRLASVTKPITAALIRSLIAEGKLKEDSLVFPILEERLEEYQPHDDRWRKIKISHLLEHKGGWDRIIAFDPVFYTDMIRKKVRLDHRPTAVEVAQFMLDYDLQFEPGERVAYSNFGYLLLGQVAEVLTKKDYYAALTEHLLKPAGIKDIKLAKRRLTDRYVNEPAYSVRDSFDIEMMGAHGGLVGNTESLCQFLAKFWLNGKPRKSDDPPQDLARYGSLPRTTAVTRQYKGWDVVILCNGRREGEKERGDYVWHNDYVDLIKKVNAEIEKWPVPDEPKD